MDLLIDTFGTKVGCSGERIILSFPGIKEKKEYPIRRLSKILILRPASLTTHAVRLALENDVDIAFLGSFQKPIGRIFSSEPKGLANLRRAQLEVSSSEKGFDLAKILIASKCLNQIRHMRYLGKKYKKDFSKEILQAETLFETISKLPYTEKSRDQLRGIEGYVAEKYFYSLRQIFPFPGRKPQNKDKFNNALDYGYGFLYNEVQRACLYVGLDPFLGINHGERYGQRPLEYDIVEEFRVPMIDMAIFPLFTDKKISRKTGFEQTGKYTYRLSSEGKAVITKAIHENMSRKVMWRGKSYTLKQIIENQVRALARHFTNPEEPYVPFDTAKLLTQ